MSQTPAEMSSITLPDDGHVRIEQSPMICLRRETSAWKSRLKSAESDPQREDVSSSSNQKKVSPSHAAGR
jgi:hypothetical protein